MVVHCRIHNVLFNSGCTRLPNRNIYRFNEIYNTGYDLVNSPSALLLQSGDGIQAYGNIVRDNAYFGISVNGTNTVVYDNTVVGNRYGIAYGSGNSSIITNNNVYQNSTDWWNVSNNTATNPQ